MTLPVLSAVFVTAPDEVTASRLARQIVQERLVACAQVMPRLKSHYIWEDELQETEEVLLFLKVPSERVAQLEERVLALHPYETPEFVALDCTHVSAAYGAWALTVAPPSLDHAADGPDPSTPEGK